MKKIDLYIDSLYKHMDENSEEIQALKEEMKNHLLQTVAELKAEGKGEEESFEIAINRFGESRQIEKELTKIFKVQKKFTKVLLRVGGIFLVMSLTALLLFGTLTINNDRKMTELHNDFTQNIEKRLQANNVIPREEISSLFNKYKEQLRYISVVNLNSNESFIAKLPLEEIKNNDLVYPSDISPSEYRNNLHFSRTIETNDNKWQVVYGMRKDVLSNPYLYLPIMKLVGIVCFVVYWVFFGIWGVINTYHVNRFSILWIILFFTLNIVALMLFKLDEAQWFKKSKPKKYKELF